LPEKLPSFRVGHSSKGNEKVAQSLIDRVMTSPKFTHNIEVTWDDTEKVDGKLGFAKILSHTP
jgi:hypothetical protein